MTAHRTELSCPRCSAHPGDGAARAVPLFTDTVGGLTLHACGACGGIFLGTACAQRLAQALPHDAIRRAGHAAAAARYQASTIEPLACPMCGLTMQRTQITRAGVELDVCAAHGTWYDRDELRLVAIAIGWSQPRVPAAAAARVGGSSVADVASDVALAATLDVGADVVLDGVFGLIGGLFD